MVLAAGEIPSATAPPSFSWSLSAVLGTRVAPEHLAGEDAKVALGHHHPLPALCSVPSPNTNTGTNLGLFYQPWEQAERPDTLQGRSRAACLGSEPLVQAAPCWRGSW